MALEAAFADLTAQLRALEELFDGLALTTGVDRSHAAEPILVDRMNDEVVRLQGQVKKVSAEAAKAQKAASPSADLNRARRHLAASQALFLDVQEAMLEDLLSYERLAELSELGGRSGPQWLLWTSTVRQSLDGLAPQLQTVLRGFFRCWQEIAERVGANSVSIRSIGQQITARVPEAKPIDVEGLT